MAREIPSGAVEIQTGLWLYSSTYIVSGVEYIRKELFSSEGYCFYDNRDEEEYRIYSQYASLGIYDSEDNYTSIPISELPEGSEIAGNPTKPEIA